MTLLSPSPELRARLARRGAVSLLLGVAGALVLVPTIPATAAVIAPPAPQINVPSSVIGSLDDASPEERAAAINRAQLGKSVQIPVAIGQLVKGNAPMTLLREAFMMSFDGTNWVMTTMGVPDDIVGFDALMNDVRGPGPMVPAAGFQPDMDLYRAPAYGWTAPPSGFGYEFPDQYGTAWMRGATRWSVEVSGSVATITATLDGTVADNPLNGYDVNVNCRTPDGAISVIPWVSGYGQVEPATGNCGHAGYPAGTVVDSVDIVHWRKALPEDIYGPSPYPPGMLAEGAVVAQWFPEGDPRRPAYLGAPREWEHRYKCSDGSNGLVRAAFRETDATFPPVPKAVCQAGYPTEGEVWVVSPLGDAPQYRAGDWLTNPSVRTWMDTFGECARTGLCELELFKRDPQGSPTINCRVNPYECVDWAYDPARSDNYVCRYGGEAVVLDECLVYASSPNVATQTQLRPSPDPLAVPIVYPRPVADPATGDPVPTPETSPKPSPLPELDPDPNPTTPTNPNPDPDGPPIPGTDPVPNPDTEGCMAAMASWNPVDWVLTPVKCALVWAFVPQTPIAEHFATGSAAWQATLPMVWVSSIYGSFEGINLRESGCRGPGGVFPLTGNVVYPFNACEAPFSQWAPVVKTVAGFFIGVSGTWACLSAIGRGFGMDQGPNPTEKVTKS